MSLLVRLKLKKCEQEKNRRIHLSSKPCIMKEGSVLDPQFDWIYKTPVHSHIRIPLVVKEEFLFSQRNPKSEWFLVAVEYKGITRYVAKMEIPKTWIHKKKNITELNKSFNLHRSVHKWTTREYCLQGTIYHLFKNKWCRKNKYIYCYFRQIIEALRYCHEIHNICFRTLNPYSIGITEFGKIKITNFYQAIRMDADVISDISTEFEYAAPEIIPIDNLPGSYQIFNYKIAEMYPSCDVFSLGCILHYMLYGKHLFGDGKIESDTQIAKQIIKLKNLMMKSALLRSLLTRDCTKRISLSKIEDHPEFKRKYKRWKLIIPNKYKTKPGNKSYYPCNERLETQKFEPTKQFVQKTFLMTEN
eukprot:snap_masked-scaffold_81-processed-gene-0.26-mRNA-1 protein AED:0.97 eAED:1.00 QI:0/0/0/0.5/1/1/2/0/358